MPRYHLYLVNDPARLNAFVEHCRARISHFTKTGSKSSVRYWTDRLEQGLSKLERS